MSGVPAVVRLPVMVLLLLLLMPGAAGVEQFFVGLPESDAARTRSMLWYSEVPILEPSLTLEGPDGETRVPALRVDGPAAGHVYEARLADLEPDTSYTYRVEGTTGTFRTAPDDLGDGVRIVALGDMGVSAQAQKTVDAVLAAEPDLVLHMGDISYAEGNQLAWHDWFRMVEPYAAGHNWMTALGNHEVGPLGVGGLPASTEILYYQQRMGLPGNELWYSFDWGDVHIVAVDSFSELGAPSTQQLAWLEADLVAATDAAWTIVFFHEALYSTNRHGSVLSLQETLVPIFDAGGVDLVLTSHDHGYERTHPLRGGATTIRNGTSHVDDGIVYIVSGGGGEGLYDSWRDPPEWSAARASLYHVTLLDITPEAIVGRVVPTQDTGFSDTFRIERRAPGPSGVDEATDPAAAPGPLAVLAIGVALLLVRRARNLHHAS